MEGAWEDAEAEETILRRTTEANGPTKLIEMNRDSQNQKNKPSSPKRWKWLMKLHQTIPRNKVTLNVRNQVSHPGLLFLPT